MPKIKVINTETEEIYEFKAGYGANYGRQLFIMMPRFIKASINFSIAGVVAYVPNAP